jgi:hypothetical protein
MSGGAVRLAAAGPQVYPQFILRLRHAERSQVPKDVITEMVNLFCKFLGSGTSTYKCIQTKYGIC